MKRALLVLAVTGYVMANEGPLVGLALGAATGYFSFMIELMNLVSNLGGDKLFPTIDREAEEADPLPRL